MNKLVVRLNIFLFLAWAQFLIFVISLILASYIIKFSLIPFAKTIRLEIYDGLKMSASFLLLTSFQWLYRGFVLSFLKESFLSALTLISSQVAAIFMIEKILTKTVFMKYHLSSIAIFICFFFPFSDYFISSFKRRLLKY
ncbi:MAG: hypothetical protein ACP5PA_02815 [Elusimicrobiales bacterium]